MKKLKLRTYPDNFLRKTSKQIKTVKETHIKTALRMHELMKELNGLGLSSPQVGVEFAIVVMDTTKYEGVKRTLYNPEVISCSEEKFKYNEGCLSFPDKYFETNRSNTVMVKYINSKNETILEEFTGISSVCVQHEIDHLNGKLFIDLIV